MQQENPRYESQKVVSGLKFVDGLAWSRAGYLIAADVREKKLVRLGGGEPKPQELITNDGGAAGITFDTQGRLYICETEERRLTRSDLKGKTETLADSFEGKKLNGPDDVAVRRDGHVYFTDPAFGTAVDRRELGYYGIFHIGLKGKFDAIARWQTRPGGITLSPDGRSLYVTDADRHAVVAFDVGRNGEADKPRDVVRNTAGVPGGIRTDVDGRFYVAARGIGVYTSAGKPERILIDSTNCTTCTFGEADSEYLFAASRGDIYRIKVGVKGALQY